MPPDSFLHERSDFKALVETVADIEKINDPALVEKDYWIMHAVFGLSNLACSLSSRAALRFLRVLESSIVFPKTSIRVLSHDLAMGSERENRRQSTSAARHPKLWKSSKASTVCYTVSHLQPWALT